MGFLGQLFVFRSRTARNCDTCHQEIPARAWYVGLVGKTKLGKRFTTRLHLGCFHIRMGQEMTLKADRADQGKRPNRQSAKSSLSAEAYRERCRLVSLRCYHLKMGNTERAMAVEAKIASTGVPLRAGAKTAIQAKIPELEAMSFNECRRYMAENLKPGLIVVAHGRKWWRDANKLYYETVKKESGDGAQATP